MKNLVFFKSNNLKCNCGKGFLNKKTLKEHQNNCPIHIHNELNKK